MRPGTRHLPFTKAELEEAGVQLHQALARIRSIASGAVLVTETDDAYTVWWHEDALPVDPLQVW